MNTAIDNIAEINSELSSSIGGFTLPNESFELDTDADNIPDGWTFTPYSGGAGTLVSTTAVGGTKSFKITAPGGGGNGGGYLETTDFLLVDRGRDQALSFYTKSSNVAALNEVDIRYYDINQSFLSSWKVWVEATANPSVFTYFSIPVFGLFVPASATYMKVRLSGAAVGSPACTVHYENARLGPVASDFWQNRSWYFQPRVISGTIDPGAVGTEMGATSQSGTNTDGTDANGKAIVIQGASSVAGHLETFTKSERAYYSPYLRLKATINSTTNRRDFIGLSNDSTEINDKKILNSRIGFGVGLATDSLISATHFLLLTNDNGATPTTVDTGVAFDTAMHEFKIGYDHLNGTVAVQVDSNPPVIATTDLPTAATDLRFCAICQEASITGSSKTEKHYGGQLKWKG